MAEQRRHWASVGCPASQQLPRRFTRRKNDVHQHPKLPLNLCFAGRPHLQRVRAQEGGAALHEDHAHAGTGQVRRGRLQGSKGGQTRAAPGREAAYGMDV